MNPNSILVTGSTGNIGGALLPLLKNENLTLWAGNTQGKTIGGAAGRAIDFLSIDSVRRALTDIDTAFIVIPAHPQMLEKAKNVAQAAQSTGIKHQASCARLWCRSRSQLKYCHRSSTRNC
ncbi:hypothetical protein GCM10009007_03690 [Formosimonas limnophila]|uniref:NAD(P)-binding domain-containing protein n=1 Tax=Formosimonas limnophila TaxID=1384487 RepID=A0A8J3CFP5_9BURK|nr:NAD(P)H-binding protein [Formosimonas limnophila]GHA66461.1 hypothetical protein GCM10009007_03690 [Formosimonas limnophila]